MKWEEIIGGTVVAALVGFMLLLLIDLATHRDAHAEPVTVIATTYKPSETQTGTAIDANGRPYTTVTSTSEEWTVVCRTASGVVHAVKAENAQDWGQIHHTGRAMLVTQRTRVFGFERQKIRP